ncbi:hypothetical protein MtrunA17_Chr4g0017351 [Medicago truncatula]|uniref:Uncharacterized protein n=1 Tax=Medicago truncatula TaxID=3880 RepID=A0A396I2B2_MEDTR|nr:hypothetical protein MtrunA17_Chr4g0017351 [Medicago truncatula]
MISGLVGQDLLVRTIIQWDLGFIHHMVSLAFAVRVGPEPKL